MKCKVLLICALLISVITLSGAVNRSFRTEMEQWNPIGFTQAPSGSPITNRLTAGSAILPAVATAASSGVLRGGSTNVITFTTAKAVGESVKLSMQYHGAAPTLSGATGTPKDGEEVTYTLTSQTVTIRGDVFFLECDKNQLTALDVSQNTALTRLYCNSNHLKALDVSKNTALTKLSCGLNPLTALDVSKNTALTSLTCSYNQLTALDVSKNTALTDLYCHKNQLTTLNVSKNTALTRLFCFNNQLTTLDVSKNTALKELNCSDNQLTTLDVSKNTALTWLFCGSNQLTALDVSKYTELRTLNCCGNQIKGKEMTRLVNSLPDRTGKDAGEFTVVQEPDLEGNICLKSDVAIAESKNWSTKKYKSDTKESIFYRGAELIMSFTTAKAVGEKIKLYMLYEGAAPTLSGATGTPKSGEGVTYTLTSQTVTIRGDVTYLNCSDNQLTALNVSKNTEMIYLNCSRNQLTALDVSKNTELTYLICWGNQLTALDVSKNTALKRLSCSENQLTTLDVSKNTALTELNCDHNQLTALDVSKNTALTELNCDHNQLTALDVSKNTALTELNCYNNQLTALDVSKNTALTRLNCSRNQIKGEEMTHLVNSLPDRTGKVAGRFAVVQESSSEGNRCLKTDVSIAKRKNWKAQKYNFRTNKYVPYEGEEAIPIVITFKTAKAVGETVELYMKYSGDTPTLSGATGTPKSGIKVTYTLTSQTVTITGGVTFLDCSGNQLTTSDVSENTSLTTLDCSDNQLTTLDVSKNTALTKLSCSNNQLTALDLSQNTALKFLYCTDNQLTALDLSKNTALAELNCCNNQLTALDVSKNTALRGLGCFNNQLTTLDVSQNTSLTWFFCSGNQIKGKEMTRLVNSLPDRTGKKAGTFIVVREPDLEGNICLKSDVAIAKGKNWDTQKYKSDTKEFVPYEGAEEAQPLKVTLTKEGEGTLTATGAADLNAVPEGTELTIVATPADGYELKALTANGTDILATKKFTVTADTEVKATFTKKTAAEVVAAGTLRLYPNPASAYVNVKGAKANALVRLYDANGTLRYEARTAADGTLQIDLSAYAEGTYLLLVDSNAQRLLIQR